MVTVVLIERQKLVALIFLDLDSIKGIPPIAITTIANNTSNTGDNNK